MRSLLLLALFATPALADPFTAEESFALGQAVGFFNGCTSVLAAITEPSHDAKALDAKVKRVTDTCLKQAILPVTKLDPELLKRPESVRLLGDAIRERTIWFKEQALLK